MVDKIQLTQIGRYTTGSFDESAAEIPAYDPETERLFVVNGNKGAVDVLDLSNPSNPTFIKDIDITRFGGGLTSVAVQNGVVAVAVENTITQDPGRVVFFDPDGNFLNQVTVGALPDMLTFSPDGTKLLVANEGEPSDDYTVDPEGSISIIDISGGIETLTDADVTTANFSAFNDQKQALTAQGVRIFGPDVSTDDPDDTVSVAQDLEPEYIAVTPDSSTAFVSLQENNALAKVDISAGEITDILPLGFKDYSESAFDPSDEDGEINLRNFPVLGMYQPDAIATYEAGDGETYIVTANEGDSREYIVEDKQGNETEAFVEEARVADISLDSEAFPNAENLQQEENLGRLKITTTRGDTDGDGEFEQLYSFGGRSFSIFDPQGNLVFDSGDDFETITAAQFPEFFNSDNDENSFDTRSDDKGPEPEGVVIGEISGQDYAFIGLERIGGIMVYDITKPTDPEFIQYINTRDFSGDPEAGTAGNLGPEGLEFISAAESPTGIPLLAVGYEVSGSTSIFEITTPIYAIQGEGQISPFADNPFDEVEGTDETVTTRGIVTAVDSNGFYLQDPVGDGDIATSDGIFVFTGDSPSVSVGDQLQVQGTVTEFIPGGIDTGNLPITEIVNPTLTTISTGNQLPEAVVIGEDRTPPTEVIDDDGLASYDPSADGIDFYESLEGMRVTVKDALSVSATNRFGEIFTVANNGENATNLSDRGTINIDPDDFNPERIQVQFDSGILPDFEAIQVDVGAELGDVTGVVGYAFGNYEVNITEPFEPVELSNLEPEITEIVGTEDQLTVASYNVLNLDPNDEDGDTDLADGRFEQIASQVVNNLQTPDIIALQEIQDNDGSVESDVTAADQTLSLLVEEIEAISGLTYEFIDNPFIGENTSGGQPGGNIRTAYLYNSDRVDFVEGSLDAVVNPQNQQTDPSNPFFDSRLPLAATFTFNNEAITLVNNHFSSKGGSSPLFGQIQPAVELQEDPDVNGSLDERREQANAVAEYVEDILAENPDANVAVLGDLNEFEFISPLEILEGEEGLLTNLTETLPTDERYSFIFQGNSQTLDHILVSNNLSGEVESQQVEGVEIVEVESAEFDQVHVNTEFSDPASDHEPLVARFDLGTETEPTEEEFTLQILHTADQEGGLPAIADAVNFSAVINGLEDDFANTLKLSSGDLYIPGPFFAASDEIYDDGNDDTSEAGIGDILINNALGFQAVSFGNHEFDQGTDTVERLIEADPAITGPGIGEAGYQGTLFPYLSSNLNFAPDQNLADLVVEAGESPQPNSITDSVVIEVDGETIGVVGATTPTLEEISSPGDVEVLPSDDDTAALAGLIQKEVDALTATGINKVILLAHFQQISIEEEVASLVDDVDVVIAGGSNTLLANEDDPLRAGDTSEGPYPMVVDSDGETVYVINTDGNYKYVGRLVADFDQNGVITSIGDESGAYATDEAGVDRVYGEDVDPTVVADPTVVEVTEAIGELTLERDGNVFGLSEVFLNGERGDVRTQETNLGNLTADANLFYADFYDDDVVVSIKNGGGIRDSIGTAIVPPGGTSSDLEQLPPQANPAAGKEEGEISQLDIENSLRFNNALTLLTVTAEELEQIIEFGVSATEPGATPGQFPQVGGLAFSFDPDLQAIELDEEGNVITEGDRIQSLALTDDEGNITDTIVEDGELVGDPGREIRIVTLNFLASGGDGYPFPTFGENRVDLVEQPLPDDAPNQAMFTEAGTEQDALAEYLAVNFPADDDPSTPAFDHADTAIAEDERIQNLNEREDTILPEEPQQPVNRTKVIFGTLEADLIDTATENFDGSKDIVLAGAGDDLVDASIGTGGNRIFGGAGDDEILVGTDDRAFGNEGDDLLDASLGTGGNRIYGNRGDDLFFLGADDRLFGGKGDDQFYVISGGDNIIAGGAGADQFWLAAGELPDATNTILDFELGVDIIGIGGLGISSTDQLEFTQSGNDAVIGVSDTDLAVFRGISATDLPTATYVLV